VGVVGIAGSRGGQVPADVNVVRFAIVDVREVCVRAA